MRRLGGEEYFGGVGVRMVACGLIVTQNNTLWKMTSESAGFISAPHNIQSQRFDWILFGGGGVVVAAAGSTHSAVLTTQGCLYAWDEWEEFRGDSILTNLPQRIVMDFPATLRFGRWHIVHPEEMLAFVMGCNHHLAATGDQTEYSDVLPEELFKLIAEQMRLRSRPGTSDGFQDMLGRHL